MMMTMMKTIHWSLTDHYDIFHVKVHFNEAIRKAVDEKDRRIQELELSLSNQVGLPFANNGGFLYAHWPLFHHHYPSILFSFLSRIPYHCCVITFVITTMPMTTGMPWQGRQRDGKEMLATMEERMAEVTIIITTIIVIIIMNINQLNIMIDPIGDEKECSTGVGGERGPAAGSQKYGHQVLKKY